MANPALLSNGVAPNWIATGDGDYTPPGNCIGFYVTTEGAVSFTSFGQSLTVTFAANQMIPANVDAFVASGTTATGIYAIYI